MNDDTTTEALHRAASILDGAADDYATSPDTEQQSLVLGIRAAADLLRHEAAKRERRHRRAKNRTTR